MPRHLEEVRTRRLAEIAKVEREVKVRLTREINYWDSRAHRLREEQRAGKDQRLNAQRAERTAETLADRLQKRLAELDRERQISALPPLAQGEALIVPAGLLQRLAGAARSTASREPDRSDDPVARALIERLAMEAVMAAETEAGHSPKDISAENRGYDIESRAADGTLRFIEVKGRAAGARDLILTQNEVRASLNAPERWWLAVVEVEDGFAGAAGLSPRSERTAGADRSQRPAGGAQSPATHWPPPPYVRHPTCALNRRELCRGCNPLNWRILVRHRWELSITKAPRRCSIKSN